jgi:DNA ligase 1
MKYSQFVNLYESLGSTTKRLEKTAILAEFLKKLGNQPEGYIYLLKGRVFPEYDPREFGISDKLAIKALSKASGESLQNIQKKIRKTGDIGEIAESLFEKRKQSTLFSSKLTTKKVFDNLQKLVEFEGKGSVNKKLSLISELLNSASGKEAKYIIRTLLNDLRIGAAEGVLRDSITKAFFNDEKSMTSKIEMAYDLSNDYALVFKSAMKGKKSIESISITPGRPMKVMLPIKVTELKEAFRICGIPAAIEHKYDGFRVLINKDEMGTISLFTRKLDNITKQFPDIVKIAKNKVKGKSYILDTEVVGYDPKTKNYRPFEAISQRIKRKYDIDKLQKNLPVEINVFDILYHNGKAQESKPFNERRKLLEKIITETKYKIRPSMQFITDDEKKALEFYKQALKTGEEGIMIKKLDAPYQAGRRVGYMVKLKPEVKDLDLVIVGAEYGSGKRGGWLTSYIVAVKDNENGYLEVGKVASGLKEKENQEGTTYEEITNLLKPLIIKEKDKEVSVKPKLVVSVTYQNIQKSPSYSSGFALRFPRITHYRPDRKPHDITTFSELKADLNKQHTEHLH